MACCANRAQVVSQPELADLHLIAALQLHAVHAVVVDVRTVEASHVHQLEAGRRPDELHMLAGNRDVIQEDVGIRVPARRGGVRVQQETSACVGTLCAMSNAEFGGSASTDARSSGANLGAMLGSSHVGVMLIEVVSDVGCSSAPFPTLA